MVQFDFRERFIPETRFKREGNFLLFVWKSYLKTILKILKTTLCILLLLCLFSPSNYGQYLQGHQRWYSVPGTVYPTSYLIPDSADHHILIGNNYDDMFRGEIDQYGNITNPRSVTAPGAQVSVFGFSVPVSGNPVLAGSYGVGNPSLVEGMLVGLDSAGSVSWARSYDAGQREWFNGVAAMPGGGYIAAGTRYIPGADSSGIFWVRTDGAGNLLQGWYTEEGEYTRLTDVIATADSGAILIGRRGYDAAPGSTAVVVRLLKVDNSGAPLWQKYYSGLPSNIPDLTSVVEDPNNHNLYVAAGADQQFDLFLKFDSQGNFLNAYQNNLASFISLPSRMVLHPQSGDLWFGGQMIGLGFSNSLVVQMDTTGIGAIVTTTNGINISSVSVLPSDDVIGVGDDSGELYFIRVDSTAMADSLCFSYTDAVFSYSAPALTPVTLADSFFNFNQQSNVTLQEGPITIDNLGCDGTFIPEPDSQLEVLVYPNPVTDQLTLQLGEISVNEVSFRIYSAMGVEMEKGFIKPGEYGESVTVEKFPPGVYLVEIQKEGDREVLKFVKR